MSLGRDILYHLKESISLPEKFINVKDIVWLGQTHELKSKNWEILKKKTVNDFISIFFG